MQSHQCIYLHGFASGPSSTKANYFSAQLRGLGFEVNVPNLNGNSFTELTLSSQLQIIRDVLQTIPANEDVLIVGSSMGGLLATLIAAEAPRVKGLILLAPGFGLNRRWHEQLSPEEFQEWKQSGSISVFNYAVNRKLPLKYQFIEDAERYQTEQLIVSVPTLVLHGIRDEVVPIWESENFQANNNVLVEFHALNSDHGLVDDMPGMWSIMVAFLERISSTVGRTN